MSGQLRQGVHIVDGEQRPGEHLACNAQVAQVGAGEIGAGIAAAIWVDRAGVSGERSVSQVEPA